MVFLRGTFSDIIDSNKVNNYLHGKYLHFYASVLRKLLIPGRFIIICNVSTTLFIFFEGGWGGAKRWYGPGTCLTY